MQNQNIFLVSQGPFLQMGREGFNFWQTGSPFEKGSGHRSETKEVKFKKPFQSIPSIHAAFSWLDSDNSRNLRIKTSSSNVTVEGFTLVLETYADTRIYAVEVSWVAGLTE